MLCLIKKGVQIKKTRVLEGVWLYVHIFPQPRMLIGFNDDMVVVNLVWLKGRTMDSLEHNNCTCFKTCFANTKISIWLDNTVSVYKVVLIVYQHTA